MNHKEHIKKLRQKRKGKITQIQKYFETYYPNLKLKYSIGNIIKIRCNGKILCQFNSLKVIGNKLDHIYKLNHNSWRYIEIKMYHILLNRLGVDTKLGYDREYKNISIPKYYHIIRDIESHLLKEGLLRITPKLKRKSL